MANDPMNGVVLRLGVLLLISLILSIRALSQAVYLWKQKKRISAIALIVPCIGAITAVFWLPS